MAASTAAVVAFAVGDQRALWRVRDLIHRGRPLHTPVGNSRCLHVEPNAARARAGKDCRAAGAEGSLLCKKVIATGVLISAQSTAPAGVTARGRARSWCREAMSMSALGNTGPVGPQRGRSQARS